MEYIRGFLALFILLALLLYMVPEDGFKKYIRFFMQLVLTLGLLSPVLSFLYDSEEFLGKIAYEEFTAGLAEISKDTQKIEFLQNDYYIAEYEQAIGMDIAGIAGQHGFRATDVEVRLTDDYVLESISLWITNENVHGADRDGEDGSSAAAGEQKGKEYLYAGLKEELLAYYQVEETQLTIHYSGIG